VVVLCYHSVHPTYEFASATPAQFDEQVGWLRDHCEIIRLSEVLDRIKQPRASSRPTVAITFDDGYEDNFFHALPVLLRHGVKASFFLTTGLIDRVPSALDHMRRIRKMDVSGLTWEQVSEIRQAGMQIGSHTVTHANLTKLDDQTARMELTDSKHVIEDHLGEEVSSLAYPFGLPGRDVTDRTIALALGAGYETAVSILYRSVQESDHAMSIPRIAVKNNSMKMLRGKVVGSLDIIGRWQARVKRR
jgi:peptidoglycan/xylan/chitin deacetylase (PgdA/CDA1 family)